nr:4251_t:CDS:2 [Entrophospora candida]
MPSSHLWTPSLEPRTIINSWAYKHAIINECISIGKEESEYESQRDIQGAQTADDVQDDDESTGEEEEEDNEDLMEKRMKLKQLKTVENHELNQQAQEIQQLKQELYLSNKSLPALPRKKEQVTKKITQNGWNDASNNNSSTQVVDSNSLHQGGGGSVKQLDVIDDVNTSSIPSNTQSSINEESEKELDSKDIKTVAMSWHSLANPDIKEREDGLGTVEIDDSPAVEKTPRRVDKHERGELLLTVNVELEKDCSQTIYVHVNDDPADLAKDFCDLWKITNIAVVPELEKLIREEREKTVLSNRRKLRK